MAYLNSKEREDLANELINLKFNRAKGKIRRMDNQSRLAYLRNVQDVNQWATRYELPTLGAIVTLIEEHDLKGEGRARDVHYELVQVIVAPTAENNT